MIFNVKSKYILEIIFSNLEESHRLYIIKYNNNLKNNLGFDLGYYKNYSGRYKIEDKDGRAKEYSLYSRILLFDGEYKNGRRSGKGNEYYFKY